MEPRVRVAVRQSPEEIGRALRELASMEPRVRVAVRPDSNQSEGVLWSASMEASESRGETLFPRLS